MGFENGTLFGNGTGLVNDGNYSSDEFWFTSAQRLARLFVNMRMVFLIEIVHHFFLNWCICFNLVIDQPFKIIENLVIKKKSRHAILFQIEIQSLERTEIVFFLYLETMVMACFIFN